MSLLLSSTEIAGCTGIMRSMFDTFCLPITVHKTPLKLACSIASGDVTFGYSNSYPIDNFTYTPVNSVFSGRFYSPKLGDNPLEKNIDVHHASSSTQVKVHGDCYDYITNGTTEKISIAGSDWKIKGQGTKKYFLTDEYYVFDLEQVQ